MAAAKIQSDLPFSNFSDTDPRLIQSPVPVAPIYMYANGIFASDSLSCLQSFIHCVSSTIISSNRERTQDRLDSDQLSLLHQRRSVVLYSTSSATEVSRKTELTEILNPD